MSASGAASIVTNTPTPGRGCKTYFQWFLYFLRIFTILALLMNLIAYCLVIKIGVTSNDNDVLQKTFVVLQNVGLSIFIICLMIAEFQPVWFVKRAMIFYYWGGRGFCQAWNGIQLIANAANAGSAVAHDVGGNSKSLQTFAEVAGWILFSIGILMMLMSALCLRGMAELKADKELEAALLAGDVATVVVSKTSTTVSQGEVYASEAKGKLQKEVDDLQGLVQNLSTAMGISYVTAQSKFGGKAGAQAAENFQREMKQKEQQLKNAASSAGNAARQTMSDVSNSVSEAASKFTPSNNDNNSYDNKSGSTSTVNMPSSSSHDDEPVGRRKRGQMDDDELERMYYGGRQ